MKRVEFTDEQQLEVTGLAHAALVALPYARRVVRIEYEGREYRAVWCRNQVRGQRRFQVQSLDKRCLIAEGCEGF